jgi:hypothetical protein
VKDAECYRLADRAMDLLASCNRKEDLPQCDSVGLQRARNALERLRKLAKENLEGEKE